MPDTATTTRADILEMDSPPLRESRKPCPDSEAPEDAGVVQVRNRWPVDGLFVLTSDAGQEWLLAPMSSQGKETHLPPIPPHNQWKGPARLLAGGGKYRLSLHSPS